jgi:hypothetical protein
MITGSLSLHFVYLPILCDRNNQTYNSPCEPFKPDVHMDSHTFAQLFHVTKMSEFINSDPYEYFLSSNDQCMIHSDHLVWFYRLEKN